MRVYIPLALKPRSQTRRRAVCSGWLRTFCIETIGDIKSYQSLFVHGEFGAEMAANISELLMESSVGPGVDMSVSGCQSSASR